MRDHYKRLINYLRISLTDRCNLSCTYCKPQGDGGIFQKEILTDEEILRVCRVATGLGITNFKLTGGEPLLRKSWLEIVRALKAMEGVETVTLTTNGVMLRPFVKELAKIGIDGINISLDTTDPRQYEALTGRDALGEVTAAISACSAAGIKTKINAVLLADCREEITKLAAFAKDAPVDVRFIELMPIGVGALGGGIGQEEARAILRTVYPDLTRTDAPGNGPAHYESSGDLQGRIGWIDAMSHRFCESCNRIRLTCDGLLKPCLCYRERGDLRAILRSGGTDEELTEAMRTAILQKPLSHCFSEKEKISESRRMSSIGG